MYDFKDFKQKIKDTEEWLSKEFGQIRTGRATPQMLDGVSVEVYGSMMPVSQVANITIEDPRTLRIAPWDNANIKPIEKAILISNTGLSVAVDDKGLRVSFPPLTTESRGNFVKLAKAKLEDAKVALRQERNRVNDDLNTKKKDSEMSEDEVIRAKAEVDKLIKEGTDKLEVLSQKKEQEIMN
jgi:ribosome recycling factor